MQTYDIKDAETYKTVARDIKLVNAPLDWQLRGLQQTSSGYGAKLTTVYKAPFEGRFYRVYCTIYSNSGTCWFTAKGKKYIVS